MKTIIFLILKDANILADVYMSLTGGQSKFEFISNGHDLNTNMDKSEDIVIEENKNLIRISSSKDDINAHEEKLLEIEKSNSIKTIWRKF